MSESQSQRARAAGAVALAVADDPFYRSLTAAYADRPAERHARLTAYVAVSMDEAQHYGRLLVDPNGDGAAIWTLPVSQADAATMRRAKYAMLREVVGEAGLTAYQTMVENMEACLHGHLPADAWYLSILGVDPGIQGRGTGRALLAATLAEADAAGVASYLETFNERSIRFYERLGYTIETRFHEAWSAADYWLLVRRPKPG